MSFLDRFKPQPRWKHADPAVRAAAVADIPDDVEHDGAIWELASADEDVRVRRAAAARVYGAADLTRLARAERNEDLRRELSERLVAIAIAADETDGEAALALDGLDDQRQLSTVSQQSPFDTVRTAALGRIHDVKLLGSVARKAVHGATALEAVTRIVDAAELLNVALKTEHKDAGISALERVAAMGEADPEIKGTLDAVAGRAKNKSVSKRARAMMQAIEETEAARRSALEAWQQSVASLVTRVEALASAPATAATESELEGAQVEWGQRIAQPEFDMNPEMAVRFANAVERTSAAIAAYRAAESERLATEARRLAVRQACIDLIERLDGVRGEYAPAEIERARSEWAVLAADETDPEIGGLRSRFEVVAESARRRHENRLAIEQSTSRLAELAADAERLAGEDPFREDAWRTMLNEWTALQSRVEGVDPAVAQQHRGAMERVEARDTERRAAAERAQRQHVQRIEQLLERAQKRVAAEDLTIREADRLGRDIRTALEGPQAGDEHEQQALTERLKAAAAALTPRLHDLREMDEWKRFANAAVQEELIAKAEALRVTYGFDSEEGPKQDDLDKAARELHEIQERWKSVAEAPRAQAQALWHRYRQAVDPVQTRLREFFAHRNEERKTHLDKKVALIERAEQLADSTDWVKTAEELKRLQAEWQQIGPVPRQDAKASWKRFRDACDRFFTRRNADLAERKETWSANLQLKEALCARAEELAASREWDKAAAEIRRLQVDWKNIGPVRRNKSEAVWQRFRGACDTFFDRYKRRDEIDLDSKQADREQLVAELEALSATDSSNGTGLLELVRSLRSRWNQSTPVVRHGADPLSARFVSALEHALMAHPDAFRGTELDVEPNRQKMEKLCVRVEGFLNESAAPAPNSSQALADMLREALAANTIGGRAGEENKWRTMAEDVRQAQASWTRLGPVPGDSGRALNERFHRATSRFFDLYRRKVPQQQAAPRGARPVGTR